MPDKRPPARPSVNDALRDAALHHQQRTSGLLNGISKDLAQQLADARDEIAAATLNGPQVTAPRQAVLFKRAAAILSTAYDGIAKDVSSTWEQLGEDEVGYQRLQINNTLGVQVGSFLNPLPRSIEQALGSDVTVIGRPAAEWWDAQEATALGRFQNVIRAGVLAGETNQQIRQKVVGTKRMGYADGFLSLSRRQGDALVRTGTMSVANSARLALFSANTDVVRGVAALVTLDYRTTPFCISQSGASWDLVTGDPLPESARQDEKFFGPSPWHWGCRSVLIAVLRAFSDIMDNADQLDDPVAAALDGLTPSTQASMDGQVPADLSYSDWLETQPVSAQKDVLGDFYEPWKAGDLELSKIDVERQVPAITLKRWRREVFGGEGGSAIRASDSVTQNASRLILFAMPSAA